MTDLHNDRFPNETEAYRNARNALLTAEMELRRKTEEVAALRRFLPPGGALKEDYVLIEGPRDLSVEDSKTETRFSQLFAPGRDTLIVYSFMFGPGGNPCPACTSLIDGLDGLVPHIEDRLNFAVFAKCPITEVRACSRERGWRKVRLLSTGDTSFNADYVAKRGDNQIPIIHVFRKTADGIFHCWSSEMFYSPADEGQHPRHADTIWPLWNLFDLTPEGREGWVPKLDYERGAREQ